MTTAKYVSVLTAFIGLPIKTVLFLYSIFHVFKRQSNPNYCDTDNHIHMYEGGKYRGLVPYIHQPCSDLFDFENTYGYVSLSD